MTADAIVRARIDAETKARATQALDAMGLSASDAIRLLFLCIAEERRLPIEVRVHDTATREAIAELDAGKAKRPQSVEDVMRDLGS